MFDFKNFDRSAGIDFATAAALHDAAQASIKGIPEYDDILKRLRTAAESFEADTTPAERLVDEALTTAMIASKVGLELTDDQIFAFCLAAMAQIYAEAVKKHMRPDWIPDDVHARQVIIADIMSDVLNGAKGKDRESREIVADMEEADWRQKFIKYDKRGNPTGLKAYEVSRYVETRNDFAFVQTSEFDAPLVYIYDARRGVYRGIEDTGLHALVRDTVDTALLLPSLYTPALADDVTRRIKDQDLPRRNLTDLNGDENTINFQNGLLNLKTMTLTPHTPAVLSTIQIKTAWPDEDLETPVFDGFLDTLTRGDKAMQTAILEFIGMALSNVNTARTKQNILLTVGPGNTGKSQLLGLTQDLIGRENVAVASPEDLSGQFGMSALVGKHMCAHGDLGFQKVDDMSWLKQISGKDLVRAEFKGKTAGTTSFKGIFWFVANTWPRFGGDKGRHVYERFTCLYLDNVIPKGKRNPHIEEDMLAEAPGIARKAVLALKALIDRGWAVTESESMKAIKARYMEDNDSVVAFMREMMVRVSPDLAKRAGKTRLDDFTLSAVRSAYTEWLRGTQGPKAHEATLKEFKESVALIMDVEPSAVAHRGASGMVLTGWYPNWQAWREAGITANVPMLTPLEFVVDDDGNAVDLVDRPILRKKPLIPLVVNE